MKRRMVYPDVLRAIGCIAAVVLSTSLATGHIAVSGLFTWAAPLFVMLSGMFMLDNGKSLSGRDVSRRYAPRLLAAYIIWGIIGFVVNAVTNGVLSGLLVGSKGYLSFLLLMIILVAFTPALRVFTRAAQPRELLYLLVFALLIGSVFPYISVTLLGDTSFVYTALFGFAYIGVFAAGWFLRSAMLTRRQLRWIYFAGAAFLVLSLRGIWLGSTAFTTVPAMMVVSPDAIVIAVAVFLVVKNTLANRRLSGKLLRAVGLLANLSFGIYLIHPLLLAFVCYVFNAAGIMLPAAVFIPVVSIILLLVSGLLAFLIQKIPKVGRYLV